jgi:hypothetical protein
VANIANTAIPRSWRSLELRNSSIPSESHDTVLLIHPQATPTTVRLQHNSLSTLPEVQKAIAPEKLYIDIPESRHFQGLYCMSL